MSSNLDFAQCIRGAYDEDNQRLRVDALLSATIVAPPGLEVAITDSDDSIKIGNGSGVYAAVTPTNALKVDGSAVVQPVSQSGAWTTGRTWTLLAGDDSVNVGNFPATQNVNVTNSTLAVTQSGVWSTGRTWTLSSGTDSVNVGTLTSITNTVHVDDNSSSLTVDNNGTFAVQAAQSGAWNITNITGTVSLPTGAATETTLSAINGKLNSLGQKTMANSVPVVIASDQSNLTSRISDGTDVALVSTNGDLKTSDGLRSGGVYGVLTLTTANTAYEVKIGVSRLANRKLVLVHANATGIYWGLDNTVTTTTGFPLAANQSIEFNVDPDSSFQIWAVSGTNAVTVNVMENP